jgi:hypothetical protein
MDTPIVSQLVILINAQDRVGIADINHQKHIIFSLHNFQASKFRGSEFQLLKIISTPLAAGHWLLAGGTDLGLKASSQKRAASG